MNRTEMREIIIALALKHNNDFETIYDALKKREIVPAEAIEIVKNYKTECVTIVDSDYPLSFKNENIEKPPFVIFKDIETPKHFKQFIRNNHKINNYF